MEAKLIESLKGGVAAHACNTCIWEVGATGWVGLGLGNIINLRLVWIKTWSLEKPNKRGLAKWLRGKFGCLLSDDTSLRAQAGCQDVHSWKEGTDYSVVSWLPLACRSQATLVIINKHLKSSGRGADKALTA